MNCVDFPEPIKSCLWLSYLQDNIPLYFLTSPTPAFKHYRNVKIRNVEDEFELHVVKDTKSLIRTVVYRNRLNPNENRDNGYALKFCFTITGFDEETQCAIMKYDDEKAGATFMITENILRKATSTHVVFDMFLIIQMLEFKSLDKNDPRKMKVDLYMSLVKSELKKKEIKQLGCILKNPKLDDVFTGNYFCLIVNNFMYYFPL